MFFPLKDVQLGLMSEKVFQAPAGFCSFELMVHVHESPKVSWEVTPWIHKWEEISSFSSDIVCRKVLLSQCASSYCHIAVLRVFALLKLPHSPTLFLQACFGLRNINRETRS